MPLVSPFVEALRQVDGWPCEHVAVGVTGASRGDARRRSAPVPVGVGDEARDRGRGARRRRGGARRPRRAGRAARRRPFRHLLAHASGLPFEAGCADLAAGRAADLLELRLRGRGRARRGAGGDAVRGVLRARLGGDRHRARRLAGSGASRARSAIWRRSRASCARRGGSRRRRSRRRRTVQFPGLVGVLPGFGRQEPNDWGLGFELRDGKSPHWTGSRNSPRTFGHFGRSGTFLWVDPEAGLALGVPHRPGVRRLGDRRVAAPGRRGAGRTAGPGSTRATVRRRRGQTLAG